MSQSLLQGLFPTLQASIVGQRRTEKIPALMFVSAQTLWSTQLHYRDLCCSLTFHDAKNNCDNFIDLMGAGFCLPFGHWQLAAYFAGICGGVVFSGCDSRAQVVSRNELLFKAEKMFNITLMLNIVGHGTPRLSFGGA